MANTEGKARQLVGLLDLMAAVPDRLPELRDDGAMWLITLADDMAADILADLTSGSTHTEVRHG
ncbi:hypothetical protein WK39_03070 [Burkholderia cepacia]|uniref:hypothetical protein n=1 Tax=Burkholderia cepacia TaxID=292 RepID=UPI000751F509|nr:hypothetical protein [Burkholderia cepacia]KVS53273.1 hypothetical protein WK39_03070 [Burkholderia cepacia]KVS57737.1 hypothetical protein WK40_25520 [Burkholderia cepacia]CAG9268973.1 hypothetical protein BCEP4_540029 [Burkholderia cepacia]